MTETHNLEDTIKRLLAGADPQHMTLDDNGVTVNLSFLDGATDLKEMLQRIDQQINRAKPSLEKGALCSLFCRLQEAAGIDNEGRRVHYKR